MKLPIETLKARKKFVSVVATMWNKRADKDDTDEACIPEDSWSYKAVRLASSTSKHKAASKISTELATVTKKKTRNYVFMSYLFNPRG
jgi:hypothetical protein